MRQKKTEPRHDKTNKATVRPAKTQISLSIRPVWSESSLCAQQVAKDPSFLRADSEDSDQTGQMPRLIWVFAGRTFHFVGFVTRWLKKTFKMTSIIQYCLALFQSRMITLGAVALFILCAGMNLLWHIWQTQHLNRWKNAYVGTVDMI